jgi:hypothetical protein
MFCYESRYDYCNKGIGKIQQIKQQISNAYDVALRHWLLKVFEGGSGTSLQTIKQVSGSQTN